MKKELIKRLKKFDIIESNPVRLKHAGNSSFYINIKKAYGNPDTLEFISQEMWKIVSKKATCVAASGLGGIPLASNISTRYDLNLTLIREKPKGHGLNRLIEGYIPVKEDKIALIDDVFTTGKSLKKMIVGNFFS